MVEKQFTLDDLVTRTGFSKRQIRYYITEKLVPGAGNQRGPYAVYGEETLRRLENIAILKERPVGPTNRAMTLAEIRYALDNPEGSTSPEDLNEAQDISASSYLARLVEEESRFREDESNPQMLSMSCDIRQISASADVSVETSPLNEILQSLHSLLTELGSDTRFDDEARERNSWQRINSPDVEIHVRTPDKLEARVRLNRMAAQLGRLLAREE